LTAVGTLFALVNVLATAVLAATLIFADDTVSAETRWTLTIVAVGLRGKRIQVADTSLVTFNTVDETLNKFNGDIGGDSGEVVNAIETTDGIVTRLLLHTVMEIIVALINIKTALDIVVSASSMWIVRCWCPPLIGAIWSGEGIFIRSSLTAGDINEVEFTISIVTSVTFANVPFLGHLIDNTCCKWVTVMGVERASAKWIGFSVAFVSHAGFSVE
jgi:hypothetical protein